MKHALNLAEDNRILSVWKVLPDGNYEGMPIVEELPDGDVYEYRYVDGEYIHDPLPKPEEPDPVDPVNPENPETETSVWDELDAAYQEGVDSV